MLKEKTRLESSSQVVERKEEDEMAIFLFLDSTQSYSRKMYFIDPDKRDGNLFPSYQENY